MRGSSKRANAAELEVGFWHHNCPQTVETQCSEGRAGRATDRQYQVAQGQSALVLLCQHMPVIAINTSTNKVLDPVVIHSKRCGMAHHCSEQRGWTKWYSQRDVSGPKDNRGAVQGERFRAQQTPHPTPREVIEHSISTRSSLVSALESRLACGRRTSSDSMSERVLNTGVRKAVDPSKRADVHRAKRTLTCC